MSIFTNTPIASSFEERRGAGDRQPMVGELIFDSFTRKEEGQEHETIDFFQDDENLTPIFENATVAQTSPSEWGSLFDNEIAISSEEVFNFSPQPVEQPAEEGSLAEPKLEPKLEISATSFLPTPVFEEAKLASKSGGRVSKKGSPKVDHLGVTSYNRKVRTTPLSPVVADSDDPVALKRARNTEAARRSRARKTQRMNELELKVEQLLKRNRELEQEIQRLNSIISSK